MSTSTKETAAVTPLPHVHGQWYFADLHTTDVDAATPFYTRLFGWDTSDVPGAPNTYRIASVGERSKAALTVIEEELAAQGVPPYWFGYLTVEDLGTAVTRVPELGGTVVLAPMDVLDLGRMAIAQDPTGASFGLWEDASEGETTVKDEHGSPLWYELHSTDVEASLAFYEGLVGWKRDARPMGPDMTYYVMNAPSSTDELQRDACGIMQQMPAMAAAGVPSVWGVYFNVDDTDATAALAVELGGALLMGPHDIPGVGRSAVMADPQGATFSLLTPLPRD